METQTKRKIEVFTAGCSVCSPVVDMVKSMACSDCEVIVYNLAEPCESKECIEKAKTYGIKALPAVAVNGNGRWGRKRHNKVNRVRTGFFKADQ